MMICDAALTLPATSRIRTVTTVSPLGNRSTSLIGPQNCTVLLLFTGRKSPSAETVQASSGLRPERLPTPSLNRQPISLSALITSGASLRSGGSMLGTPPRSGNESSHTFTLPSPIGRDKNTNTPGTAVGSSGLFLNVEKSISALVPPRRPSITSRKPDAKFRSYNGRPPAPVPVGEINVSSNRASPKNVMTGSGGTVAVAVRVMVGVVVIDGVRDGVGDSVRVGVFVPVYVGVAVRDWVAVAVTVGVAEIVAVRVAVLVAVNVRVRVRLGVDVKLRVATGVTEAVPVLVNNGVGERVAVRVGDGGTVGVRVGVDGRVKVDVELGIGVSVGKRVPVGVTDREGVIVAVEVRVDVGRTVRLVAVGVPVGMRGVGVPVALRLGDGVCDRGVAVGVQVRTGVPPVREAVGVAVRTAVVAATVQVGVKVTVGVSVGGRVPVIVEVARCVGERVIVAVAVRRTVGVVVGVNVRLDVPEGVGELPLIVQVGENVGVAGSGIVAVGVREGVKENSGVAVNGRVAVKGNVGVRVGVRVGVLEDRGVRLGTNVGVFVGVGVLEGLGLRKRVGVLVGVVPTCTTNCATGPRLPPSSRSWTVSCVSPEGRAVSVLISRQNCATRPAVETKFWLPKRSSVQAVAGLALTMNPHEKSFSTFEIAISSVNRGGSVPGTPCPLQTFASPLPRGRVASI